MTDCSMTMVRGDSISFGVELLEKLDDGSFAPMTQDIDAAFFTCQKNFSSGAIFQKTIGNGIFKVNENTYVVQVSPSDTQGVTVGEYVYDFVIQLNGSRFTFLRGMLDIQSNVTGI